MRAVTPSDGIKRGHRSKALDPSLSGTSQALQRALVVLLSIAGPRCEEAHVNWLFGPEATPHPPLHRRIASPEDPSPGIFCAASFSSPPCSRTTRFRGMLRCLRCCGAWPGNFRATFVPGAVPSRLVRGSCHVSLSLSSENEQRQGLHD